MASPYKIWAGLQSHPLGVEALELRERFNASGIYCRLSPLIAMSDPKRTPDVLGWAKSLPNHCAIIYRYDVFDAEIAKALRALTLKNQQQLIMRSEIVPAACDGIHFKRHSDIHQIIRQRHRHPEALLTLAALKMQTYSTTLPALDGLLVSAVFPSQSPSAGEPIGVNALRAKTAQIDNPVFALGGINEKTVLQLKGTGIAGIAAIGALTKKEKLMKQPAEKQKPNVSISKKDNGGTVQFIATINGSSEEAVLDMRKVSQDLYNAHHTGVPKSMGGKGVGTALVKAMSEDAQSLGYKVIPACPFIAAWFKRKPEWAKMAALTPEKFLD